MTERTASASDAITIDSFALDNLPPPEEWPDLDLSHPAYHYPEMLNAAEVFVDRWIAAGQGDRRAIVTPDDTWSYANLSDCVAKLAHVLVDDLGVRPGNRVLLRAANTPMMVASYLAVLRIGAIAVGTMPLLRGRELRVIIERAEISHALCDARLAEALNEARADGSPLRSVGLIGARDGGALAEAMASKPAEFQAFPTRADDVALIAFTSGTTGQPKATAHFQRDLLAICDGFSNQVLKPTPDDLFTGSPPLAFTFGLGGLALFPFRVGAATLLLEQAAPKLLMEAIDRHRPTIVFTAPTAYRAMLAMLGDYDISSLRACVSAGEHLPLPTYEAFEAATGIKIINGIGATEMLHIFISSAYDGIRPGATGRVVPGYQAKVIGEDGEDLPVGEVGRLAVKGPTGCRYLSDARQRNYVRDGWNITGDTFSQDADGYFWYQARNDDMIISSGYNIAGPEVEAALLDHDAVQECAVVGAPDPERGAIVEAHVVLKNGWEGTDALAETLQAHVKATIAPFKYPRRIVFTSALPKTETGKIQRFRLKEAN
ncbi:MAG: AMP-binding protein [Pseudomonadota bacterium]